MRTHGKAEGQKGKFGQTEKTEGWNAEYYVPLIFLSKVGDSTRHFVQLKGINGPCQLSNQCVLSRCKIINK